MADEDEVDILGDYNLDSVFTKNEANTYESGLLVSQNSDLLNCDYTIHPQWLLDKPSANPENWYNSGTQSTESESFEHISTENCITDESGWTEKEKNLLESGIAIFGKSNVRLAQFIGSKSASEVKYYLKNFYTEHQLNRKSSESFAEDNSDVNLESGNIINASQIPASIEEVIAAVSTAVPTVQINNKQKNALSSVSKSHNTALGISKNTECVLDKKKQPKKVGLLKPTSVKRGRPRKKHKAIKFKLKTNLTVALKQVKTVIKSTNRKVGDDKSNKAAEHVPISEGEEIVKIEKIDEAFEDIEVNIESSDESCEYNTCATNTRDSGANPKEPLTPVQSENKNDVTVPNIPDTDLSSFNETVVKQLTCSDVPICELIIDENNVTDLEKAVHCEYFEGKSQNKTPARYLTIRNYIVAAWKASKPSYLYKTPLRSGLKHCGDVNCIGKIHYFLEQIGVINFGCEQVKYVRPLSNMIQEPIGKDKNKKVKNNLNREVGDLGPRSRIRRKFTNDGEGGCTLVHDDEGHVINKTIVNEDPVAKQRMYVKKPTVRLIYCRPFNKERPQEYTLKIHISALLAMDFHAHTRLSEVMGVIGGHWSARNKILTVSHYEPCENVASSATHCDMCPVSQAKAADVIHGSGLDILGWFHSHPTFAPEPSQQDLDTQRSVQRWIGHNKPCIGVILSPFSVNGALVASPFRCMVVERHPEVDDRFVPYRFDVEVVAEGFAVETFLGEVSKMWKGNVRGGNDQKIGFEKQYFLDGSITYLDKLTSSLQMHMVKCGDLERTTCEKVIEGITKILKE